MSDIPSIPVSWFDIPEPATNWLVDGLIPSDGHVAICGKPKAGKSTLTRSLIAAIIKGRKFLGRSIDIPAGAGKVLYIHLDRKDVPGRVVRELKDLGITAHEAPRLIFKTAQDMPTKFNERLEWLKKLVASEPPHCIVIDLFMQFAEIANVNDYGPVLGAANKLQDALIEVPYDGALIVTMHSRKAVNENEPTDDIMGSTALRGSFVTNIMLARDRKKDVYTIMSDQTIRDKIYGEIPTTVLKRKTTGEFELGKLISELAIQEKQSRAETDKQRLLQFIAANQGCGMGQIVSDLSMSKPHVIKLMESMKGLWTTTGGGVKGDPFKYYSTAAMEETDGQIAADQFIASRRLQ